LPEDPKPKSREFVVPNEKVGILRLGSINTALCKLGHLTAPVTNMNRFRGSMAEAGGSKSQRTAEYLLRRRIRKMVSISKVMVRIAKYFAE
jgi:hypothetical protein